MKKTCCDRQDLAVVADFGHASGVDFDLVRCGNCGGYSISMFYTGPDSTCRPISRRTAEAWLALQGTSELRKRLKRWFERD